MTGAGGGRAGAGCRAGAGGELFVRVIGVGLGDPDQVTGHAVQALRSVDAFFVLDKPGAAHELTQVRTRLLEACVPGGEYRVVIVPDPPRDRSPDDYEKAVADWREARTTTLADAFARELPGGGVAGMLVWGDPSMYDGTIDVVRAVGERMPLDFDVTPGVSALHALTAAHRIPLNRVAGAVEITTGRRLAEQGWPAGATDVVVFLDSFLRAEEFGDAHIYWGAYLGSADEVLCAGRVADVIDEIKRLRAAGRARHGWCMDTYLLRR